MSERDAVRHEPLPPDRLAEAGVWIARLHGDERTSAMETGFRQWLKAHPLNARAFELSTEVWEDSLNLRRVVPFAYEKVTPRVARSRFPLFAAAAMVVAVTIGTFFYLRQGTVSTGVGEQRLLTLEDGTRVFLNTATQVVVRYDNSIRRVELKAGEALFDVARRADRPFVVTAGDRQVMALGTSFVVRREASNIEVTLVDGKVAVSTFSPGIQPSSPSEGQGPPPPLERGETRMATQGIILSPGERVTFAANKPIKLDEPPVDKVTAWRRGQVILDDTPLSGAVLEMNRYNPVKLIVERPEAQALVVNGLFQAGDSLSFARAIAGTYGLEVAESDGSIVISGTPRSVAAQ